MINKLTKIIYYKLVKTTNHVMGLTKVIFKKLVKDNNFLDFILNNYTTLFISNFLLSPYYFLGIKETLFTIFYFQKNNKIKKQNNIIEVYLPGFIYWQ